MNSEIYKKNIDSLSIRFKRYADYIEAFSPDDYDTFPEEEGLQAGVEYVCGKKVLFAIKGVNRYQLDSLYDSSSLLDLWFEGFSEEWPLGGKLFMYGLGNGMYVRKFLETAREDCAVVVHEPSSVIFKKVLEEFDLSDIFADKRVFFNFWPCEKESGTPLSKFYYSLFSYSDLAEYRGANYLNYARLFTEDCTAFVDSLASAKRIVMANQVVIERFGENYLNNMFENLIIMARSKSFAALRDRLPKGMPVIVVAAGPSLDKNITEIRKAKGKALIISTDTAMRPLCNAGIVPDVGIIVDGKKDSRYLANDLAKEVPLICCIKSGNEFLTLHRGDKYFIDDAGGHIADFFHEKEIEFPMLDSGGSVATFCFDFARILKPKCIILAGQDLAYTGDKTHSVDTVRGEKPTAVKDLEHPVMDVDINGDPIRTSEEFLAYKDWFEQQTYKYPDLRVIDATEGGVRIKGTHLLTLKEAIAAECIEEYDFTSPFINPEPLLSEEKGKMFADYVKNIPVGLDIMREFVESILADYSEMHTLVETDRYKTSKMIEVYNGCKEKNRHLEEDSLMEYVNYSLKEKTTRLLKVVNKLEKDEKTELLTACELGEGYLKDVLEAITEVKTYADIINEDFP